MNKVEDIVNNIKNYDTVVKKLFVITGDKNGVETILDRTEGYNLDKEISKIQKTKQICKEIFDAAQSHLGYNEVVGSNNYAFLKTIDLLRDEYPAVEIHWIHMDDNETGREGKDGDMCSIGTPFYVLDEYARLYDEELMRASKRIGGENNVSRTKIN